MSSRRFSLSHEVEFSRAQVWDVLAHTDALNRQIGLSAVAYGESKDDQYGLYRPARSRVGGLEMRWREYGFQWEQDARYSVMRRYIGGPIEWFEGGVTLEALNGNRTRLTVWSEMKARGALGHSLIPLIARRFLRRTMVYCKKIFVAGVVAPRAAAPAPPRRNWSENTLQRLTGELQKTPIAADYALALSELLRTAGDEEVADLRPFAWADAAGLERDEALRTCLYAVRVGMLNLRWTLMCPNCRVSKGETDTLAKVGQSVHCELCGADYALNFDRYVELKFAVHPSVRVASNAVFCLAGPFRAPHILEQVTLSSGREHVFKTAYQGGVRLRVMGLNYNDDLEGGEFDLRLGEHGLTRERCTLAPNQRGVRAINSSAAPRSFVLEKREWDEVAVTAARVTALQEFRDLFSGEVLAPGRQVAVENVTIFFSDLSNSTALYERIGDAPAYSRVGSHFEFLTEHIARGQGAVVKTMGDAVMAVFNRPEDAVATALAMQREFRYFSETMSDTERIALKIGLHCGPALAVNSNDRLDYFGRTVNIAARAVGVSNGDDVILTGEVWHSDEVRAVVEATRARAMRFNTTLRGVEASRELVRLQIGE